MKFTEAWAGVAQENVVLKFTVAGLIIANAMTAFAVTTFALKKPLVIARGELTKTVKLSDDAPTEAEVDQFVRTALIQRFDSNASIDENLFVLGETKNRQSELKEMASRNMDQKIIVNQVTVADKAVTVDADRIIKVGEVKTILPFPLKVKIVSVDRSAHNPYGLKVSEVTKIEPKEGKNEK